MEKIWYYGTRGPWATSLTWENTREEDLNFVTVFSLLRNNFPLLRAESRLPKDALYQVLLKLAQMFWRNTFLNFIIVFLLLDNYLPLERGVTNHLYKLNPLHPRMLCAIFGWNWPHGLGEEKFKCRQWIFYYLLIICPWKGWYLIKL